MVGCYSSLSGSAPLSGVYIWPMILYMVIPFILLIILSIGVILLYRKTKRKEERVQKRRFGERKE